MTKMSEDFTLQELQTVIAAREIKNGDMVLIGTGLPLLAAMLAQMTHAPDMVSIYESGAIDSKPKILPLSISETCLIPGAAMVGGLLEALGLVHAGDLDIGFLGGAQIDMYGNLNSHVIGDYYNPAVRFAGSGGANDIASGCQRTIIIMPHTKRRFVKKVDFITTPGYLTGGDSRDKLGFPGKGPAIVVSNLGVMRFETESKEMYVESLHPGASIDQIKDNTDWDIKIADQLKETTLPTVEEIRILRRELDPDRLFLREK
jgi:glutaconate CoA-transferase subunit B